MIFTKNTRVILTTRYHGDNLRNPVWNGEHGRIVGTVTAIVEVQFDGYSDDEYIYTVKWDNNKNNMYRDGDLNFYTQPVTLPEELFTL